MDLHALAAERLGEGVVLLLGPAGPEHVVEEQLADVTRGEPGELEPGPVHDDLPELTYLELVRTLKFMEVLSCTPVRGDSRQIT